MSCNETVLIAQKAVSDNWMKNENQDKSPGRLRLAALFLRLWQKVSANNAVWLVRKSTILRAGETEIIDLFRSKQMTAKKNVDPFCNRVTHTVEKTYRKGSKKEKGQVINRNSGEMWRKLTTNWTIKSCKPRTSLYLIYGNYIVGLSQANGFLNDLCSESGPKYYATRWI